MSLTSPNRGYQLLELDGVSGRMHAVVQALESFEDDAEDLTPFVAGIAQIEGAGAAMSAVRIEALAASVTVARTSGMARQLKRALAEYSDAFDTTAPRIRDLVADVTRAHAAAEAARERRDAVVAAATAAGDVNDRWGVRESAEVELTVARAALGDAWEAYEYWFGRWEAAYERALDMFAVPLAATGEHAHDPFRRLQEVISGDPGRVAAAWNALSLSERRELVEDYPEIVGNLDGVPYADPGNPELKTIGRELRHERAQLLSFQPNAEGQVLASLGYGDVAHAVSITVLVPGMMTTTADLSPWGETAKDIVTVLADQYAVRGSASIVWFGYDTPNVAEEPGNDHADKGAGRLSSFLGGVRVENTSATLTVGAHSYGSTTAGAAIGADPGNLGVDRFVTFGSAGLLRVEATVPLTADPLAAAGDFTGVQVFATRAPGDAMALLGRTTGEHPAAPEEVPGAMVFDSDGGHARNTDGTVATSTRHDGAALTPTPGHSTHGSGLSGELPWNFTDQGYLVDGTESFYNFVSIIATGRPGTVRGGVGSQ